MDLLSSSFSSYAGAKLSSHDSSLAENLKLALLTDDELHHRTEQAACRKQKALVFLLEHLREVDTRRVYAKRGHSSLYSYVRSLGFSEAQSSERVNAARLLRELPELKSKLEGNGVSLTTASQLQRFFKKIELKIERRQYSAKEKMQVLRQCENKSKRQLDQILCELSPAWAEQTPERVQVVSAQRTKLRFQISNEAFAHIERIRELEGNLSLEALVSKALANWVGELEKKRKSHLHPHQPLTDWVALPATEPQHARSRSITAKNRLAVSARSKGQCEFRVHSTGVRCMSRYRP